MKMWQFFQEDARAWKRKGLLGPERARTPLRPREVLTLLWRYPGMRATLVYRLGQAATFHHIPLLPGMLSRFNLRHYGLDLVSGMDIGPGLYIPHPVGTVIMANRIGRNCSLIHAITIGMRNEHVFPTLGDDVTIGAGARVLGGIRVGNGAQIGANAVVIADVPDGATAVGVPARVVSSRAPARVTAESSAARD